MPRHHRCYNNPAVVALYPTGDLTVLIPDKNRRPAGRRYAAELTRNY